MTLKRLTGIIGIANRWFPKRHHHKARQNDRTEQPLLNYPYPGALYGYRHICGEWWVCASDGERLFPKGTDRTAALRMADLMSKNAATTRHAVERLEANRQRIAQHVRENFDCAPNGGAR